MPDLLNALLSKEQVAKVGEHYRHAQGAHVSDYFGPNPIDMPETAPPSFFQPDPLVVGDPLQAQLAKRLLDADPLTKARVKDITFGPTPAIMKMMIRSGLHPDQFEGTTLLGGTDSRPVNGKKQIGINPGMTNPGDAIAVLSHEIGHAAGWGEAGAEQAAKITGGTYAERYQRAIDALQAVARGSQVK